jgi:uncharacterized protein
MELETRFIEQIAAAAGARASQVERTIGLLAEGATIPFIARYRKEVTGNLDERQIRTIEEQRSYFLELVARRNTVLKTIEAQGKLTPELEEAIMRCADKAELEDLYLPYKPRRRTKATIARERGLEPLAEALLAGETPDPLALAWEFVDPERGVPDAAAALEGARHIIAERVAEDAELRGGLRQALLSRGLVVSRKIEDLPSKFEMYYEFSEPAASIPSHRMLAIRRGAAEGFLTFEIELPDEDEVRRSIADRFAEGLNAACAEQVRLAAEDAYKRLLRPSLQTEVRTLLKQRSDEEAIRVFEENLANLLLAPPAGSLVVMGLDPGYRTGCKVAVVDGTGKFLESATIYPAPPRQDATGAARVLDRLIRAHGVQAIAIGNGTASRETDRFVRDFLRDSDHQVFSIVVNEAGASVYSASELAQEEHPDLDVTVRGAISIARRLQDPLAEQVKIDPKSIGVGQYQHDVDQKRLRESLHKTVESVVNRVGVELNTASWALLRYTAGISERVAREIVRHRDEHGPFRRRKELLAVRGLGPKAFEQAAGFLRIRNGEDPLDNTGVHPESYPAVRRMAQLCGVEVRELIGNGRLLERLRRPELQARLQDVGRYTLHDIIEELNKPGRDPRETFVTPSFRDDINEIEDLQPGMKLQGTVTNVTRFGAFVDIGVHHDGLVHVSHLEHRFVQDPTEVIKVGQVIEVEVLDVDLERKRISLSRKACLPRPGPAKGRGQGGGRSRRAPRPKGALAQQLARLDRSRFRR